jgi:hypothetical protein
MCLDDALDRLVQTTTPAAGQPDQDRRVRTSTIGRLRASVAWQPGFASRPAVRPSSTPRLACGPTESELHPHSRLDSRRSNRSVLWL